MGRGREPYFLVSVGAPESVGLQETSGLQGSIHPVRHWTDGSAKWEEDKRKRGRFGKENNLNVFAAEEKCGRGGWEEGGLPA